MMKALALSMLFVAFVAALPYSEFAETEKAAVKPAHKAGGHWIKSTTEEVTPGYESDDVVGSGYPVYGGAVDQDEPVWDDQDEAAPEWDGNYTDYAGVGVGYQRPQQQITRWGKPYKAIVQKKAVGEVTRRLPPIVHNYGVPLPPLHSKERQEDFTRDYNIQRQQVKYTKGEYPEQVPVTHYQAHTTYTKQPYSYQTYKQVPTTRQVPVTTYKTQHFQTAQTYETPQYHQVAVEHNVTEVHYKPVVTVHYVPQKEVHYVPVRTQIPQRSYRTVVSQVPHTREIEHFKQVPVKTQEKQTTYTAQPVQHTAYRQVGHTTQIPQVSQVRQQMPQRVAHQVPIQQHQIVHYQRQVIDRPHYVDQDQDQDQYQGVPQYSQPIFDGDDEDDVVPEYGATDFAPVANATTVVAKKK